MFGKFIMPLFELYKQTNKAMKNELKKELEILKEALKKKSVSVNEYCDFYYALHQKYKECK